MIERILRQLRLLKNPTKDAFFPRFFKTGKGEYGEGDVFLGVTVPQVRSIAKNHRTASFPLLHGLLSQKIHEARLLALVILVHQYEKGDPKVKKRCVAFYLQQLDRVNNWDLVDLSSYKILGDFLLTQDRTMLRTLAKSSHLWSQRVAIVSTYAFIRRGEFSDTLQISKMLLAHPHDLIHKAVGWMLREVGKRDPKVLRKFLDQHSASMPRTMLRSAIEKFPERERKTYLSVRSNL